MVHVQVALLDMAAAAIYLHRELFDHLDWSNPGASQQLSARLGSIVPVSHGRSEVSSLSWGTDRRCRSAI